jgi:hypothetical protein
MLANILSSFKQPWIFHIGKYRVFNNVIQFKPVQKYITRKYILLQERSQKQHLCSSYPKSVAIPRFKKSCTWFKATLFFTLLPKI